MFIEKNISPDKIQLVMNSADSSIFNLAKSHKKTNKNKLRLFYHGTLVERYGVDLLIEASKELRKERIDFILDIYGQGDSERFLRKLIDDYSLQEYVNLNGFVLIDNIPEKILEADLCFVPNRKGVFMDTALPTKLLEYVIMEKPVIVSRVRAVKDIFSDEEITYFNPDDINDLLAKIRSYIKYPQDFEAKIKKAVSKCNGIAWERQKQSLLQVYA